MVDVCLYHNWRDDAEIIAYLSAGQRDYLGWRHTSPHGPLSRIAVMPSTHYSNPFGDVLAESYPEGGGLPGSDLEPTRAQHLNRHGIGRAILSHQLALGAPASPTPGWRSS